MSWTIGLVLSAMPITHDVVRSAVSRKFLNCSTTRAPYSGARHFRPTRVPRFQNSASPPDGRGINLPLGGAEDYLLAAQLCEASMKRWPTARIQMRGRSCRV